MQAEYNFVKEGATTVTERVCATPRLHAVAHRRLREGTSMTYTSFCFFRKLAPMHKMLFTWDNPAGPRTLIFEGYKKKEIENDLRKDGIGDFM